MRALRIGCASQKEADRGLKYRLLLKSAADFPNTSQGHVLSKMQSRWRPWQPVCARSEYESYVAEPSPRTSPYTFQGLGPGLKLLRGGQTASTSLSKRSH